MVEQFKSPPQELPLNLLLPSTRLERLKKTSTEAMMVAAHELGHWVVGHAFGHLGDISMNPEGYSRARTSFYGHINPSELSYMLGAGAVDTPHSRAYGFGMDKFMIEYLESWTNIDFNEARRGAREVLDGYDFNVLKRAAEIIAFIGNKGAEISGETIQAILERAKMELVLEGEETDLKKKIKHLERKPEEFEEKADRTIIEDKVDYVRIVYVKKDGEEMEAYICKICGEQDGRHNDIIHKQKGVDINEEKSEEYVKKVKKVLKKSSFNNKSGLRAIPETKMTL